MRKNSPARGSTKPPEAKSGFVFFGPASPVVLGPKVRSLRLASDLTLEELGERSGLDASYISKIERAKFPTPKVEIVEKLAKALSVPVSAFMALRVSTADTEMEGRLQKLTVAISELAPSDAEMVVTFMERIVSSLLLTSRPEQPTAPQKAAPPRSRHKKGGADLD